MRFRNALLVSSLACAVAVASAANSKTIGMVAVASLAASAAGVLVAATDYVKALPGMVSQYVPRHLACLGTDGFGRSENRASLRDFFEVDAKHIVLATLTALARDKQKTQGALQQAIKDLAINPEKPNPVTL